MKSILQPHFCWSVVKHVRRHYYSTFRVRDFVFLSEFYWNFPSKNDRPRCRCSTKLPDRNVMTQKDKHLYG